jgi:hypothetical protein
MRTLLAETLFVETLHLENVDPSLGFNVALLNTVPTDTPNTSAKRFRCPVLARVLPHPPFPPELH